MKFVSVTAFACLQDRKFRNMSHINVWEKFNSILRFPYLINISSCQKHFLLLFRNKFQLSPSILIWQINDFLTHILCLSIDVLVNDENRVILICCEGTGIAIQAGRKKTIMLAAPKNPS